MSNYFYVAPEQLIRDRAEFAQKGIARGRSIVGAIFDNGVVLVAENPSASLFKISEIYDRIAFARCGKYNEFDRLARGGHPLADSTGFTYSRGDVDVRALANYYANTSATCSPKVKSRSKSRFSSPTRQHHPPDEALPHCLRGHDLRRTRFAVLGGDAETIKSRFAASRTHSRPCRSR